MTARASMMVPRTARPVEFRLIYMASFLYFLVIGFVARALPRAWRPCLPGMPGRRSVLAEARATASMLVPFAFMH